MAKLLSLDLVNEGSVLAEPVTNTLGQVLINSGVELSAKHLAILRTWNIQTIKIVTDDDDELSKISDDQIGLARQNLLRSIDWQARNEAEEDLIELAVIALAHRINNNEVSND